ncbi:MAG: ATP-binding cassette domain-containing protein [Alistipes sp.]|nr:ATP-binding cassette domain-containing protein [Alistipes sp.]
MERNHRVVELTDVSVYHTDGASRRIKPDDELVLSDVNLTVREGEIVYFIGRVGSGKSTLLKTLYAEVPLLEGEGRVVGMNLRKLSRSDIPYLRRRMGIVFQDYQLLGDRNVFYNLYDVMRATGWKSDEQIRRRISEVLTLVGLDNKAYKMPFELSGGEQQRLTIARALVNSPRLLLADEPTGNLDPVTADGIMQLFQEIASQGCAIIMSTHNTALIEQYPARTLLFSKGKIQEIDLEKSFASEV